MESKIGSLEKSVQSCLEFIAHTRHLFDFTVTKKPQSVTVKTERTCQGNLYEGEVILFNGMTQIEDYLLTMLSDINSLRLQTADRNSFVLTQRNAKNLQQNDDFNVKSDMGEECATLKFQTHCKESLALDNKVYSTRGLKSKIFALEDFAEEATLPGDVDQQSVEDEQIEPEIFGATKFLESHTILTELQSIQSIMQDFVAQIDWMKKIVKTKRKRKMKNLLEQALM